MLKRLTAYIILFLFLSELSRGQEVVIGLQTNQVLKSRKDNQAVFKGLAADPIELPFFDDFSGQSYTPSTRLWSDDYTFINNTYSDRQVALGMATFDALDEAGNLYETTNPDVFEADKLTSQPVNLNFPASDNIWLSFYYQSGGLGDAPDSKDSLTLQFFAPDEDKWYSVWRKTGEPPDRFKPVIIRIDNPRYLKTGFKFRFVNWASLNTTFSDPSMIGNCDIWNLDYVYLNRNRNEADTSLADVAFRTPVRSLLKTHEAMPWKQFRQVYLQEMGSSIPVSYRNNDKITRNVTRDFEIRDMYTNTVSHSFTAGATNIDPYTNVNYNANLIYTFNSSNNDSALFKITSYLKTDDFDPKGNDTIIYYQVFNNYFAYDDGSAEAGYGINGQGSRNAMAAVRFKSYMPDTIRAISLCFNDSYMNSNQRAFDLMIWDDDNGLPGNVIYSVENLLVEPADDLNGFHTYELPDGVMVEGVFYVGWKQRSETFLNVGFDVNTSNLGRQFFWLNGVWLQSQKEGSVMIRPVVGELPEPTSVGDIDADPGPTRTFRYWPNPATDYINLELNDPAISGSVYVSIIDLQGRVLINEPYSNRIDISSLKAGLYTAIIISDRKRIGYFRIVKTK